MKYTLIVMGCVLQRDGFDLKPSLNSAFIVNEQSFISVLLMLI